MSSVAGPSPPIDERREMDMDTDTYHSYMAAQKAKTEAIRERAEAKLRRLGGETASRSSGDLTAGLTAEEIEKDTRSIKRIMRAWALSGKHAAGVSTVQLPSGKVLRKDWSDDGTGGLERAVPRLPRRFKKGR